MSIRAIDVSNYDPVTTNTGELPELGFVPIDKLVVDENYQRGIDKRGKKNVYLIAENFEWAKFSPLMVSVRPDGLYAIIDGQHRAHAAALLGITKVPAMITDLTTAEQASAFSWINGSVTALNANQIYRAALAAMEPWAVQCDAVVTKAGCRLMTSAGSAANKKSGEVYTVNLVRKHVDAGNAKYVVAVLEGIRNSPMRNDVRYYNGYGLNALIPAAIMHGVVRHDIIAAFLAEHDLEDTHTRVLQILKQPEFRSRSFRALFGQSVATLLKDFAQRTVKNEDAA